MPRGGVREPGPGKELGRPKKKNPRKPVPYRARQDLCERLRELGKDEGPAFLDKALDDAFAKRDRLLSGKRRTFSKDDLKITNEDFKPWSEYPTGTRALAIGGGEWEKTESGWKWRNGDTFPRPGANVGSVIVP